MLFRQLFDVDSGTYSYLLGDEATREAVLIDPVLDQIERDVRLITELELQLLYTLETHVHADHITASGALRKRLGSRSLLSVNAGTGCADLQVNEGEVVRFGACALQVLETPGHTDGCLSFFDSRSGRVFTGDALLIRGCGRTDFQHGSASTLFHSITEKLFGLPDTTEVYPGHDYQGRTMSTIGEERRLNPRLANKSEAEFVQIMDELKLQPPKHLDIAVPANMACGQLRMAADPTPERGWAPIERVQGVPEVSIEWLRRHVDEVRVVDVRDAEEFQGPLGHVPSAELVPLGGLNDVAGNWDREQPLVLVCRSGRRSATAAATLETLGFKRVASMRGGMMAWAEAPAL